MDLEQQLFKDTDRYIYLDYADDGIREQAVPLEDIKNIILIADETLWPDNLKVESGYVVYGTGLFMKAYFSTKDGDVDYFFQNGKDGNGQYLSTLVKVANRGKIDTYWNLFKRNNQLITDEGELLEAYYLATYKEGRWYVLDKNDRDLKLDCESKGVLSRARRITFKDSAG